MALYILYITLHVLDITCNRVNIIVAGIWSLSMGADREYCYITKFKSSVICFVSFWALSQDNLSYWLTHQSQTLLIHRDHLLWPALHTFLAAASHRRRVVMSAGMCLFAHTSSVLNSTAFINTLTCHILSSLIGLSPCTPLLVISTMVSLLRSCRKQYYKRA